MCLLSVAIGLFSSAVGLLLSYHASLPSGPAIMLSAGFVYFISVIASPRGLLLSRLRRTAHRSA
jgi:zinc/manganese transport system permease protein